MYSSSGYKCLRCYSGWDVFVWICRIWGVFTSMVLWGVGIEGLFVHVHNIGLFILFTALVVSFFESVFVILFWAEVCSKDEESCCLRFWQSLGWLDDWKKGCLYLLLACACFLYPKQFWLGVVAGCVLVICALLYFIKTVKTRQDFKEEERRVKSQTYGRFDSEVQEDIEDNAIGPDTEEPIFKDIESVDDNVGDQEEILDV